VWALLRNSWRQLTSMRTALVLLFLLAVAAIPGSVLPQRSVNQGNVDSYFAEHPKLAPMLDRLGGFDVYASAWFAAIYLLLFTSLVGCVVPRLHRVTSGRCGRVPPDAPRRLDRLPQHAYTDPRPGDPAAAAAAAADVFRRRRYRTAVREQPDGAWTVAAEKGYLKETGNLLFHFALLAVLVGRGLRALVRLARQPLLVAGADRGSATRSRSTTTRRSGPGWTRRPARLLPPLTDFAASYEPNGIPKRFLATVDVTENGGRRGTGRSRSTTRCGCATPRCTCSATATRRSCGTPTVTASSRRRWCRSCPPTPC
jgi:cytochrome c biogenesis protein